MDFKKTHLRSSQSSIMKDKFTTPGNILYVPPKTANSNRSTNYLRSRHSKTNADVPEVPSMKNEFDPKRQATKALSYRTRTSNIKTRYKKLSVIMKFKQNLENDYKKLFENSLSNSRLAQISRAKGRSASTKKRPIQFRAIETFNPNSVKFSSTMTKANRIGINRETSYKKIRKNKKLMDSILKSGKSSIGKKSFLGNISIPKMLQVNGHAKLSCAGTFLASARRNIAKIKKKNQVFKYSLITSNWDKTHMILRKTRKKTPDSSKFKSYSVKANKILL
ncbi:unnamed protein product [Moneuplotes crassus]|uniref:Uncharacterized protein n=1 Tax=Euplotes crassus TaxID=5936 RepID=A0AAD1XKG4_EUPCR|nr:unnamed protein product [Moneuplotes crassus]